MQAAIGGVFSVMNQRGGHLLDAGALQRYLAEGSWLPAAFLPRYGVAWDAIDDTRARGTLVEGGTSVSLEFTFDADGDVTYVYSRSRPRELKGHYVPTPWGGRSWNYQERCGMRIPLESEVEWIVDGARQPYFRGRIVNVQCDAINGGE